MNLGFQKFELDEISQRTIRFAARLFDTLEQVDKTQKSYNCPLVGSFQLAKSPLSSSPGFGKSNLNFSF